jgi:hypothetical protein
VSGRVAWKPRSEQLRCLSAGSVHLLAKDMRLLRAIAMFRNLAFVTYGPIKLLPPVLFLHLVLLLNTVRAPKAMGDLAQADGASLCKLSAQA